MAMIEINSQQIPTRNARHRFMIMSPTAQTLTRLNRSEKRPADVKGVDVTASLNVLYLGMMIVILLVAFIGISGWHSLAQVQHVIVLKNGCKISVQDYREEGSM